MIDCYKIRITGNICQSNRVLIRLLKHINRNRREPLQAKLVFVNENKEDYCIIKVPDEQTFEKFTESFPVFVYKVDYLYAPLSVDVRCATKHGKLVDTTINQFVCGYIDSDYLKANGIKNTETEIELIAKDYRSRFFANPHTELIKYQILDKTVEIDNRSYNPVAVVLSPDMLYHKNITAADFSEAIAKRYIAFNRAMSFMFSPAKDDDCMYVKSDIFGTPHSMIDEDEDNREVVNEQDEKILGA